MTTNRLLLTATIVMAAFTPPLLHAKELPHNTQVRARTLLLEQVPGATITGMSAYTSKSTVGEIGKILNASTQIEYRISGGETETAIMLPDGQHLLMGKIVQPYISAEAIEPVAHSHLTPMHKKPETEADRANHLLEKFRLKPDMLQIVNQSKQKHVLTPEEFFNQIKAYVTNAVKDGHNLITTGHGPRDLYIFSDPNCPHCREEAAEALKYEDQFTFHWIPIYGVTPEPTVQQVALAQPDPDIRLKYFRRLMKNPRDVIAADLTTAPQSVALTIRDNELLLLNLREKGTPDVAYINGQGLPTVIHGHFNGIFDVIKADIDQ